MSQKRRFDTVIIGGGQAGLAMSLVLQDVGREHIVLERARVAERWRSERWDALRFQFPNWTVELPGMRYSGGEPDGFAGASDIVLLLEQYAESNGAPVVEGCEVTGLQRDPSTEDLVLTTSSGKLTAANVVVATGPFQRPAVPPLSQQLPAHILQLDPTRYRRPGDLPPGAVLVVGSGASGAQIADDLLRAGRTVYLSVSGHRRMPRRFRGRDVYWWLEKLGRFALTVDDLPRGRRPPGLLVTGVDGGHDLTVYRLAAEGAVLAGHLIGSSDGRAGFANDMAQTLRDADRAYLDFLAAARAAASGLEVELAPDEATPPSEQPVEGLRSLDLGRARVTTVIWATGYEYAYDWLHLPVLDERGSPVQRRGVTSERGLYFLGLHWMHTLRSGLLMGVGEDARFLGRQIEGASA